MEVLDTKLALPGVEKFNTIQDILDQNKYFAWLWLLTIAGDFAEGLHGTLLIFAALYRILINEISSNHEARTPEGLARNIVLIRELNSNVAKVCAWQRNRCFPRQ